MSELNNNGKYPNLSQRTWRL